MESFRRIVEALRLEKCLDKGQKAFSSSFSDLEKMNIDYLINLEQRVSSLENYIIQSLQHE